MEYQGMKQARDRQRKHKAKDKTHLLKHMTLHALQRATERSVKVKDICEGRACVKQITDGDGRFITIIPNSKRESENRRIESNRTPRAPSL